MKNLNVRNILPISKAIELVKQNSVANGRKFIETFDVVLNLGINPKQTTQNVRGSVELPHGTGKSVRVIVFTEDEKLQKDAKKAGAVEAGLDELIDKINQGFDAFDYCVATPEVMKSLGKVSKKLGPKGLMPNPKNGNITTDVTKAVTSAIKGKVNFKNDKYGILHLSAGKLNFTSEQLIENTNSILNAVKSSKPEGVKGKYIKSVYFTSTMGSSVEVDIEMKDK